MAAPKSKPSFAEIGREAANAAQREALLEACEREGWNLAVVAEDLSMGDASGVIRALKRLAPKEYERAKERGKVAAGRHRDS